MQMHEGTHIHSPISIFVGTFVDIMHFPAPYPDPNHPNYNLNPNPSLTLKHQNTQIVISRRQNGHTFLTLLVE